MAAVGKSHSSETVSGTEMATAFSSQVERELRGTSVMPMVKSSRTADVGIKSVGGDDDDDALGEGNVHGESVEGE